MGGVPRSYQIKNENANIPAMQTLAIPIPSIAFGYPLGWALLRAVVVAALDEDEDVDEKDGTEDEEAEVMIVVVVATVLKFERVEVADAKTVVFEGEV